MDQNAVIILYIVKFVLGGLAAFLAIMLWSKTRDPAWMSLVAGAVTGYTGIMFNMMLDLGIITAGGVEVFGIPLSVLVFTAVPSLFFILAFALMLIRSR
ncbi:hypothetical protein HRI96_00850 [Treponema parvum]|uniref:Uncharacterized protein n=1 Tax=Treponema parvum TaxID=138851 RepID=A0A975EXR3_9SPIR|nr:hypothetical protein [Treponema parvum]QTQ10866.1 hypothetical protein HRI96_00850 [Treponema parvum]QTQ17187.1 hypothetical protein HXT04_11070 [Treponema parvum]